MQQENPFAISLGEVIAGTHILMNLGEEALADMHLGKGIVVYYTKKQEFYVQDILSYSGIRLDMQSGEAEPFVCGLYVKDYYNEKNRSLYASNNTVDRIYQDLIEREAINKDAFYDILHALVVVAGYARM